MAADEDGNYEDVTKYTLDESDEAQLMVAQNECTFMWSTKEGWPVGVIMSYVHRHGRFWLTASSQRARISAVRRDPRVCIAVTSTGSSMGSGKTVTYKGMCTVHDDRETKDWFYPALAEAFTDDPDRQKQWVSFLDSPRRVILEVEPTKRIAYDGAKMAADTATWLAANAEET